ncbi:MAG: hypothetical protein J6S23_01940 [Clostridia bacterium]|nr:hypothetical protein [Clostridia bacterium]
MIISKLIGGVIITICSLKVYSEIQKFQKKRIKQINAFIELIEYIKNQIECFLLPIDTIINNCDADLLKDCGIQKGIKNCSSLKNLISSVTFYCDDEAIDIIWQFAENFGHNYSREQIIACEHYKNELIKIKDAELEKEVKNKRVQLAIFLSISFSIIILLI